MAIKRSVILYLIIGLAFATFMNLLPYFTGHGLSAFRVFYVEGPTHAKIVTFWAWFVMPALFWPVALWMLAVMFFHTR